MEINIDWVSLYGVVHTSKSDMSCKFPPGSNDLFP